MAILSWTGYCPESQLKLCRAASSDGRLIREVRVNEERQPERIDKKDPWDANHASNL
jgi:hypothetical protein